MVVGGLLLVLSELALPGRLGRYLTIALDVVFAGACGVALSRIAVAAATEYAARHAGMVPALGVLRVALRVLVAVLAAIMALEALGVPVAPLLTTLGVGSLAVALALQETLANFFAGLYLLADRPVRAGDYIKIENGEAGYVEAIGWRSSRLRTLANNVVIVPNRTLSQAIITNYHLPAAPVSMTVAIIVAGESDSDAVERTFADELARVVGEVPELRTAKPVVRLADVTDVGQVWHLIVEVPDVESQKAIGHIVRLRALARLRREHIALAARSVGNAR